MTKNLAIGKVECPVKLCTEQCEVFRYRERGEDSRSIANRRFAGKLYCRCPKHGQFGGATGDADMQDYILKNAQMDSPGHTRPAGTVQRVRVAPQPTPPPPPRSPRLKPRPAAATVDQDGDRVDDDAGFGFFR